MKKRGLLLLCMCVLAIPALAFAQEYKMIDQGFRFEAEPGERVLTRENLSEHADFIASLGGQMETTLANYQASGTEMEIFSDRGDQYAIAILEDPVAARYGQMYAMDEAARAAFLEMFASLPYYQDAAYSDACPGWLRLTYSLMQQQVPVYGISYVTVENGRLYKLDARFYQQEPTEQQDGQLIDALSRLHFLGTPEGSAAVDIVAAVEPPQDEEIIPAAEVEILRENACPIELDAVPSVVHSTKFDVTGVTTGGAELRYFVDGIAYDKYTAKRDGTFKINVRLPEGSGVHRVEIESKGTGIRGRVAFMVEMQQIAAPITILSPVDAVETDKVFVKGKTVPKGLVSVRTREGGPVVKEYANDNGDFSVRVTFDQPGIYNVTVSVVHREYLPTEKTFTVSRVVSAEDRLAGFRKQAKDVAYQSLLADTGAYAGTPVIYHCAIVGFGQWQGQPTLLIATDASRTGEIIAAVCAYTGPYDLGQQFQALCVLTGARDAAGRPVVTLEDALIP